MLKNNRIRPSQTIKLMMSIKIYALEERAYDVDVEDH